MNRIARFALVLAAIVTAAYLIDPTALLLSPVAFGALTLEDGHLAFQRLYPDARSVPVAEVIRCFKKVHAEHLKNIQLQVVPISGLSAADAVVADVGCKLYLLVIKKPAGSTTDAWFKGSNHATTAAANGDIVMALEGAQTDYHTFFDPQGLNFDTGLTVASHTTVSGSTDSAAADAPTGFAVIGAAA